MKLKRYLFNEEKIYKKRYTADDIKDDCSEVLSVYENVHRYLYRGIDVKTDLILKFNSELVNRRPKHTPRVIHDVLNDLFNDKFGWECRNGIYAGIDEQADNYGTSYIIFPVDGFKIVYNKHIPDLYITLSNIFFNQYHILNNTTLNVPNDLKFKLKSMIDNYDDEHDKEYKLDRLKTIFKNIMPSIKFDTIINMTIYDLLKLMVDSYVTSDLTTYLTRYHENEVMINTSSYYACKGSIKNFAALNLLI